MSYQFLKTLALGCVLVAYAFAATLSANTTFDLTFDVKAENSPLITDFPGFALTCNNCTVSGTLLVVQGSVDGPGVDNFFSNAFVDVLLFDFSSTISLEYSLAPGVSIDSGTGHYVNPVPLPGGLSSIQNITIPGFGTMNATLQLSLFPSYVSRSPVYQMAPDQGDVNFTIGFQSTADTTLGTHMNLTHNYENLCGPPAEASYATGFDQIQGSAVQFNALQMPSEELFVTNSLQAVLSMWFNAHDSDTFEYVELGLGLGALDIGTVHIPYSSADCTPVYDHTDTNSFQYALQVIPTFLVGGYGTASEHMASGLIEDICPLIFNSNASLPTECLVPKGNNTGLVPATQAELDALSAAPSSRVWSGTFFGLLLLWSMAWML